MLGRESWPAEPSAGKNEINNVDNEGRIVYTLVLSDSDLNGTRERQDGKIKIMGENGEWKVY